MPLIMRWNLSDFILLGVNIHSAAGMEHAKKSVPYLFILFLNILWKKYFIPYTQGYFFIKTSLSSSLFYSVPSFSIDVSIYVLPLHFYLLWTYIMSAPVLQILLTSFCKILEFFIPTQRFRLKNTWSLSSWSIPRYLLVTANEEWLKIIISIVGFIPALYAW